MYHIVIIGNGISGITAARNIRKKSDYRITVVSSESEYFFSRTALMYVFMGHMKFEHIKPYEDWFWEKNRIELVLGHVTGLKEEKQKICLSDGQELAYDYLIIATGSKSRIPEWKGKDLKGVHSLYSLQDLQAIEDSVDGISGAVIIGGGLIGVEMAEMLHSRGIKVTMLILEEGYWRNVLPREESDMIGNHLLRHGIDLLFETELNEIVGDESGVVTAVRTKNGDRIDCQFVGITVGVEPNVEFLRDSKLEIGKGIIVDEYLSTNFKNIFAIGDCTEQRNPRPGRNRIEPVWYTGRMMGEVVAETICGIKTPYDPGVWFNSAKFFDIEYQTYGNVMPELRDDQHNFFWRHPEREMCLRLVYEAGTRKLAGVNTLGIRLRHEVCNKWIKEEVSIIDAIENLDEANFDPEFSEKYKYQVMEAFNRQNPGNERVEIKKSSFIANLFN